MSIIQCLKLKKRFIFVIGITLFLGLQVNTAEANTEVAVKNISETVYKTVLEDKTQQIQSGSRLISDIVGKAVGSIKDEISKGLLQTAEAYKFRKNKITLPVVSRVSDEVALIPFEIDHKPYTSSISFSSFGALYDKTIQTGADIFYPLFYRPTGVVLFNIKNSKEKGVQGNQQNQVSESIDKISAPNTYFANTNDRGSNYSQEYISSYVDYLNRRIQEFDKKIDESEKKLKINSNSGVSTAILPDVVSLGDSFARAVQGSQTNILNTVYQTINTVVSGAVTNTFSTISATSTNGTSTFTNDVTIGGGLIVNNFIANGHINTVGNVTAGAFYGDGSNLTGITSFSTSTIRSVFAAGQNLLYDSLTGMFSLASTTARGMFSSTAVGIDYSSSTGVFSLTSGYTISKTASTTEWAAAYASSSVLTASTTALTSSVNSLTTSVNTLTSSTTALTSFYNTLNASTTELSTFYTTPSTKITAGSGLSWSSNTISNTGVLSIGGLTGNVSTTSLGITSSQWTTSGSDIYYTSGNVGIGTSNPQYSLDVQRSSGATGIPLQVSNNFTTSSGGAYAQTMNLIAPNIPTNNGALFYFGKAASTNNSAIMYFNYQGSGSTANAMSWGFYGNDFLMNLSATGNLGIGNSLFSYPSSAPIANSKIHIDSGTGLSSAVRFTANATTGKNATDGTIFGIDSTGNSQLWNYENLDMYFGTNNTERMRITNGGNLGIGTTAPTNKLVVQATNGNINIGTFNSNYPGIAINNTNSGSSYGGFMRWQKNGTNQWGYGMDYNGNGSQDFWLYNYISSKNGLYFEPTNAYLTVGGTTAAASASQMAVSGNMAVGSGYVGTTAPTNGLLVQGKVGIGTTTPTQALSVSGSIFSSSLLGGSTNLTVDANGVIIRDPSDRNLKENIETLHDSLDKIMKLRGVSYQWVDKDRFGTSTEIGVVAQEVEAVVPEVVSSGGAYKSVNIKNLVALLIEGIKELKNRFDKIAAWFSSTGDSMNVQGRVCVDDVCVTKEQFKEMLLRGGVNMYVPNSVFDNSANSGNGGSGSNGEGSQNSEVGTTSSTTDSSVGTTSSTTDSSVGTTSSTTDSSSSSGENSATSTDEGGADNSSENATVTNDSSGATNTDSNSENTTSSNSDAPEAPVVTEGN